VIYRFEDCVLDVKRRELRCNDMLRGVEPQVFDLLLLLVENRDRVLSRDDIFEAIWGDRIVSDSVLSTRINAVRNAIGDSGAEQRLIRTVARRGFRFVGSVREESAGGPRTPPAPAVLQRFAFAVPDAPRINVQPFANIGGDLPGKRFADAMTEEIIVALTRLGWLFVTSHRRGGDTAFPSPGSAGRKLPAYELQGSLQHIDGRLRFAVRLVEALSGHHLWAERYERVFVDSLSLQDELVEKLTIAIGGQLFDTEKRRAKFRSPASSGAWGCIVRALVLMNTRGRQEMRAARALLRRAIEIDPRCAPAYSLLSLISTLSVHMGWDLPAVVQPFALQSARTALALDDEEPWGHVALGYATLQLCQQPNEAIGILERAIALNPNLAVAHYFVALSSTYLRKPESAFDHADMAERLAPFDLLARAYGGAHNNVRATASFVAGRYHQGAEFARKAIVETPAQVPAYRQLVTNGAFAGDLAEAASALRTVKKLAPGIQRWLQGAEAMWAQPDDYKKYLEAFRLAGLK
jgi:DNA-binding winged helix-turn-helix (wHTH) protein/tetratricopeptide (TPR) repeat protein